ncbi:MBL fold metallo-hydrolase [Paenibacillus sp. HB172176]|uniref:MBL fold metallo-hydrolase n=1 Tax=Paenibacillus sp. HB172176 TaxID=2493690 RepID=UPI001438D156|nr:MBL fold metallo-hydrolase [Paenibacillus sp. HB172176]
MAVNGLIPIYKSGKALLQEIQATKLPEGGVALWSMGQAGVLIKGSASHEVICIDPYLTFSIETTNPHTEFKREIPPPLSAEELQADTILLTHFHGDHMDLPTIEGVYRSYPGTRFVAPATHAHLIRETGVESSRIIPAKHLQPVSGRGISITPVAAAHTQYETDSEGNHCYLGYFIEMNGVRIYHSGDTVVTPELLEQAKAFRPHISLLPINGGDYARTSRGIVGNMSFREAADFGVEIGTDLLIPVHFDMFPNNRDNPAYFVDYLFQTYRAQKHHMMVPGERLIYFK